MRVVSREESCEASRPVRFMFIVTRREAKSEMLQQAIFLSMSQDVFKEAAKTRACRKYCNSITY